MPNRTADAARVQATLSRLGFDRFHPTPILWSGSMRGCSLMVKPQSSKLITRVRFPSSPRDLGSRRFRVEALSFSLEGMTGIPSACGFVSSRARNPHAPARHPLHKSRSRLPRIASGRKCIPSRARDFRPPARHPLENYPERIVGTASTCGFVPSRARNPHAPA